MEHEKDDGVTVAKELYNAVVAVKMEDAVLVYTALQAAITADILSRKGSSVHDSDCDNVDSEEDTLVWKYACVAAALLRAHWIDGSRSYSFDVRCIADHIMYNDCHELPDGITYGNWPDDDAVDYPATDVARAQRIVDCLGDTPPGAQMGFTPIAVSYFDVSTDELDEESLAETALAILLHAITTSVSRVGLVSTINALRATRFAKLVATAAVIAEYRLIEYWRREGTFHDDTPHIAEVIVRAYRDIQDDEKAAKFIEASILKLAEEYAAMPEDEDDDEDGEDAECVE